MKKRFILIFLMIFSLCSISIKADVLSEKVNNKNMLKNLTASELMTYNSNQILELFNYQYDSYSYEGGEFIYNDNILPNFSFHFYGQKDIFFPDKKIIIPDNAKIDHIQTKNNVKVTYGLTSYETYSDIISVLGEKNIKTFEVSEMTDNLELRINYEGLEICYVFNYNNYLEGFGKDADELKKLKYDFDFTKLNNLSNPVKSFNISIRNLNSYQKTETQKETSNLYPVYSKNSMMGYMNINGDMVIDTIFHAAYDFQEGAAAVQKNEKWYFINERGEKLFEKTFDDVQGFFSDGLAVVYNDKKQTNRFREMIVIDKHGNEIFSLDGGYANESYSDGMLLTNFGNNKYGYVNSNGKIAIHAKFDYAKPFSEGIAAVKTENDTLSYIDKTGEAVIKTDYKFLPEMYFDPSFSNDLACVINEDGLYGYINKLGTIVIPFKYTFADKFSEGYALVKGENGKFGYIDTNGNVVIDFQYDKANSFQENIAAVYKKNPSNGLFDVGFINKDGKLIINYQYEDGYSDDYFHNTNNDKKNGLIKVRASDDNFYWRYINDRNEIIYKPFS